MIHLYDRATIEGASTLSLDPELRELLAHRIAALDTRYGDLTDHSEFLIVEPGDSEADIVRRIGFSPLVDPIDGHRWPDPKFVPGWDILVHRDGWFEMVVTFGSTFAYILLISADNDSLGALCRASMTGPLRSELS